MKENRVHTNPKSLFSQCDYRWIIELSHRKRTLCSYFNLCIWSDL